MYIYTYTYVVYVHVHVHILHIHVHVHILHILYVHMYIYYMYFELFYYRRFVRITDGEMSYFRPEDREVGTCSDHNDLPLQGYPYNKNIN